MKKTPNKIAGAARWFSEEEPQVPMTERGDTFIHYCYMNDVANVKKYMDYQKELKYIYEGMRVACSSGYVEIVKVLVNKFSNAYNINDMLTEACHFGRLEVIKVLMANGATELMEKLEAMCFRGHADIIDYIFTLYPHAVFNQSVLTRVACIHGTLEVIKVFLNHNRIKPAVAFEYACSYGHVPIVKFLYGIINDKGLLKNGMQLAAINNMAHVMKFLIDQGVVVLAAITRVNVAPLVNVGVSLKWFKQRQNKLTWCAIDEIARLEKYHEKRCKAIFNTIPLPAVLAAEIASYLPF